MTRSVCSCVMDFSFCSWLDVLLLSAPAEVEDRVRVAADLLDLRYDLAVERRNIGPVNLHEVARGVPQVHLDGPVGQLPDGGVVPAVPNAEFLGPS